MAISSLYNQNPLYKTTPFQTTSAPAYNTMGIQPNTSSSVTFSKDSNSALFTIDARQPMDKWPTIFKTLAARDLPVIQAILNQGGQLSITIPKRPPPSILKAIEAISNETQ